MDINEAQDIVAEIMAYQKDYNLGPRAVEAMKMVSDKCTELREGYSKLSLDWDEVLTVAEQVAEGFKPIGADAHTGALYLAISGVEAEKRLKALQEVVKRFVQPKEKKDG